MNSNEEVKMTYTSVLNKNGRPYISLLLERGKDSCEGSIPDCVITNNKGFSKEEVDALGEYLRKNKDSIIEQSKKISGMLHILS